MSENGPAKSWDGPVPAALLKSRAVGGLVWAMSGASFEAVLRIVLTLLLARLLGPEIFGIIGAALIVVRATLVLSNFGINAALVQRPSLEPVHITTASAFALGWGLLMLLVVQLLAQPVETFFGFPALADVLRVLAFAPLLHNCGVVAEGLMLRSLQFRSVAAISALSVTIGWGVVGVGLALYDFGIWAVAGAYLAEHGVRAAALLLRQPHPKIGAVPGSALRDLISFGSGYTIRQVGQNLAGNLDNIVVGRWLGAEALGFYGRAFQVVSMPPVIIGKAMQSVVFPVLARVQDDRAKLAEGYRRCTAILALITMPVAVTVMMLAPPLVLVLLGPAWTGMILPLQILAPGIFFRMTFQLWVALSLATGSVYAIAWRQGLHALGVLIGALIGARWGLPGVAAGVLAAQFVHFLVANQLALQLTALPLRRFAAAHLRGLAISAGLGLELFALTELLDGSLHPVLVLVSGIVLAGVTLGLLLRLGLFGPDGRWLLEALSARLPKRLTRMARWLGVPASALKPGA